MELSFFSCIFVSESNNDMKQTKKEIEATLRNKICKQYTSRIDSLNEKIKTLSENLIDERKKRIEIQKKYEEIEDKVQKYEDWNRRLQEFMDMNEEDRELAFAEMKTNKKLGEFADMCKNLFGIIMF